MLHRRPWLLKAAIALFAGVAFLYGSSARADYSITVTITDNHGHSLTFGPTAPNGGALGPIVMTDTGGVLSEFTGFSVSLSALESPTVSNVNNTEISGTAKAGFSATTLTVTVMATGFDNPMGLSKAVDSISSSSLPGSFTSASLVGVLNGNTVGTPSPLVLTTTPGSSLSGPTFMTLPASYDLSQSISITGIVQNGTNTFNLTTVTQWTPVVPEPASLLLVLTGLPVFGARWLRRRFRNQED